ncbi:MAG: FtsX-like permease family protein [Clostridia bacterium]|nr:FtsX-like permease family protein [Clostridia bacterium]
MIRTMLSPFLKKFVGLFISMIFVSMLSIGLLTAFASTISNLQSTFRDYLKSNGDVNAVASIGITKISDLSDITSVEGIEAVEYRLTMNAYLKKSDGRTITTRVHTFKDDNSSLFNRYILESCDKSEDKINVSVVRKFAVNNGFRPGDSVKIGFFNTYVDFYINEIIEAPEAIQARANTYVWSDNTDFGYVYVSESELNKAVDMLTVLLEQKINESETFAQYYEEIVQSAGVTFPDIVHQEFVERGYTTAFTNELLIKGKEGYTEEEVAYYAKYYLNEKGVSVKEVTENHKMYYYMYIENAIRQLRVAAIFLPVFFYAVTMVVIGLFMNQIIKSMTPQIGVMMSIGVGKTDIISIFVVFSLLMSAIAGALGVGIGYLLNYLLAKVMIRVYSIPIIPFNVNPWITVLAVVALMAFAELATLLSCRAIFKITPKDATISNEAKRRKLSPRLERFIERSPMNIKLAVNSIAQNPKRFFVSVFSIFASFVIILLSLFFYVAKTELVHQTVDVRLSFDAQVYMPSVATQETIDTVKGYSGVTEFLDCYYTYTEVSTLSGDKRSYLEILAYDHTVENDLVVIPSADGKSTQKIPGKGLTLPHTVAKALGVGKGSVVLVNGVPVKVVGISKQYAHPITYVSKAQFEAMHLEQYVSSFLVKVSDEDAFLSFMSEQNASLTVFTKSLKKDLTDTFNSIDIFIYILIGFSLGMGFIILTIMGQNALLEQKRQISVMRAIGFTVGNISNLWTMQSVSQLLLSSIFAIPAGFGAAALLFKMASGVTQTYPLLFDVPFVLFAFAFILFIIVGSHVIAMLTIKKWNLADNTRCRE